MLVLCLFSDDDLKQFNNGNLIIVNCVCSGGKQANNDGSSIFRLSQSTQNFFQVEYPSQSSAITTMCHQQELRLSDTITQITPQKTLNATINCTSFPIQINDKQIEMFPAIEASPSQAVIGFNNFVPLESLKCLNSITPFQIHPTITSLLFTS
jgi:hypothetical protein